MKILSDKSIVSFCGKNREKVATVLGLDKLMRGPKTPHGAVFEFNQEVAQELDFLELGLVSVAYLDSAGDVIVVMDELGEVRLLREGDTRKEHFLPSRGPMRSLRLIDGSLYAAGVSAQIFKRDPRGRWDDISPPQSAVETLRLSMIESIDGFSGQEIYAAADNGIIWYYDGKSWAAIETATNLAFHCITCGEDGVVYAAGQLGILARGRRNSFDLVPQERDLADIWGIAKFDDALYLTSMRAMLSLDENEVLVPVLAAMELGFTFYGLEAVDGVLWSVGEKDILKFDKEIWTKFVDPEWVQ